MAYRGFIATEDKQGKILIKPDKKNCPGDCDTGAGLYMAGKNDSSNKLMLRSERFRRKLDTWTNHSWTSTPIICCAPLAPSLRPAWRSYLLARSVTIKSHACWPLRQRPRLTCGS